MYWISLHHYLPRLYICISPSSLFLQVLRSKDVLDLKLSLSDSLNAMSDQVGMLHGDIIPQQPTKPQIAHAGPYSITIRWTKNPHEDDHLEISSYDVQWRLASSVVLALERGRATVKKGQEHMIAYEKVRKWNSNGTMSQTRDLIRIGKGNAATTYSIRCTMVARHVY